MVYHASMIEIYEWQILRNTSWPNTVNAYGETHHELLLIAETTFLEKICSVIKVYTFRKVINFQ
jgi:hypothetical protein